MTSFLYNKLGCTRREKASFAPLAFQAYQYRGPFWWVTVCLPYYPNWAQADGNGVFVNVQQTSVRPKTLPLTLTACIRLNPLNTISRHAVQCYTRLSFFCRKKAEEVKGRKGRYWLWRRKHFFFDWTKKVNSQDSWRLGSVQSIREKDHAHSVGQKKAADLGSHFPYHKPLDVSCECHTNTTGKEINAGEPYYLCDHYLP